MNEMQQKEIDEIVGNIVSNVDVIEIYLFGSFAKGVASEDSDYDLYIVIPDDGNMREREANWAIRSSLVGKQKRSIDMIVGTLSKFNRRKNYLYSIENEVISQGVKVHG